MVHNSIRNGTLAGAYGDVNTENMPERKPLILVWMMYDRSRWG